MIPEQTLEHGAQIGGGFQVAVVVQIGIAQPGPAGAPNPNQPPLGGRPPFPNGAQPGQAPGTFGQPQQQPPQQPDQQQQQQPPISQQQ